MKRWLPFALVAVFLLAGAGLAVLVLPRFFAEDKTTAWTYRSPDHGFRITLPSSDWQEVRMKGEALAFANKNTPRRSAWAWAKATRRTFANRSGR